MKLTQQDIGGEIISIITKGMYADPKDALREYIQNGIDANAEKIDLKIKNNKIIIRDYGDGMDKVKMRKSIRIGMSDKNPGKNIGFMGIGLYSSFHLCDKLIINSKVKEQTPNKLEFDFKSMRSLLQTQKNKRIEENSADQIALLTLLEKHITFSELPKDHLPSEGTRVELVGLEPNFFQSLTKIDEISEYLESVIPLPFDPEFSHGDKIEKKIKEICEKHNSLYKLIDLNLDVNGTEKTLYRPYKDEDFKLGPLSPKFEIIKSEDGFLGIAWGCLNKDTTVLKNEKVRGFLIKKNGFTIGNRSDALRWFNSAKYFNRYVGEFIILHPKLLPNGPRSDFEYSELRTVLYQILGNIAVNKFHKEADNYQEQERAEKDLNGAILKYKEVRSQLEFFENNAEKLLEYHRDLTTLINSFQKKVDTNWKIRKHRKDDAQEIISKIKNLLKDIECLINTKKKKKVTKRKKENTEKDLNSTPPVSEQPVQEPPPDDLIQLIELIGLDLNDELKAILQLIDEKYIQGKAKTEESYINTLLDLRKDIEELFEE
jgi:hypothetical protein